MTMNEELSRYVAQIEQYKEQIQSLELQLQYIQTALADYKKAKITLEKIKKEDKNNEILVPIGGGAFLNAKAIDTSKILLDIGSGLITEKNKEDAIKKIDERIEQLEKTQDNFSNIMKQYQTEANQLTAKAQQIYAEQQ